VVLLRDGAGGLDVFLVRRHGQSGFMAGATVFPGGKVDAEDALAAVHGRNADACAQALQWPDPVQALAWFVAAVRELHEESHVLLARDADGRIATPEQVAQLDGRLDAVREGHRLQAAHWHAALRDLGLAPALDLLVPFARWVTPVAEPRRFDTCFFAAALPAGQTAALDRHETTDAQWMTPTAALHDHAAGGPTLLPPPTQHTLRFLSQLPVRTKETLLALAAGPQLPTYEPVFEALSPEGPRIRLNAEQCFLLRDGRFTLVDQLRGDV
jgi:8-oxo-dGTP pyrophosphatase MutT (NUDIX family)